MSDKPGDKLIIPDETGDTSALTDLHDLDVENLDPREMKEILLGLQRIHTSDMKPGEQNDRLVALEESLAKMAERMERQQRAQQAWMEDQMKFMETVYNSGERNRVGEEDRRKIEQQANTKLQTFVMEQQAKNTSLMEKLKNEPRETVVWPGEPKATTIQGMQTMVMMPVQVIIGPYAFHYPVGSTPSVPQSVAMRLRDRDKELAEQNKRKHMLGANGGKTLEDEVAAQKWDEINKEHTSAMKFPTH
jgi:hypothetical protein